MIADEGGKREPLCLPAIVVFIETQDAEGPAIKAELQEDRSGTVVLGLAAEPIQVGQGDADGVAGVGVAFQA